MLIKVWPSELLGGVQMAEHSTTPCAVCQRPCLLESCVIDEWGRAVHESCYTHRIASQKPTGKDKTEDLLRHARELREVADQLIKKSDRLIEAYRQLTGQSKRPRSEN